MGRLGYSQKYIIVLLHLHVNQPSVFYMIHLKSFNLISLSYSIAAIYLFSIFLLFRLIHSKLGKDNVQAVSEELCYLNPLIMNTEGSVNRSSFISLFAAFLDGNDKIN